MNKKIYYITILCAIGLASSAAYYSILGLSKLFAGVSLAVIIMASFLELSKLTIASILHQYWKELNKITKIYFTISVIILSIITSLGIYGMLSSGYSKTSAEINKVNSEVSILNSKISNLEIQKEYLIKDKEKLINYSSNYVNSVKLNNKNLISSQVNINNKNVVNINSKINNIDSTIFYFKSKIIEITIQNEQSNELAPIQYISKLLNKPVDKVVNILILLIVFVFDPLAIALVIAIGFLHKSINKNNIPSEEILEHVPYNKDENIIDSNVFINDSHNENITDDKKSKPLKIKKKKPGRPKLKRKRGRPSKK